MSFESIFLQTEVGINNYKDEIVSAILSKCDFTSVAVIFSEVSAIFNLLLRFSLDCYSEK